MLNSKLLLTVFVILALTGCLLFLRINLQGDVSKSAVERSGDEVHPLSIHTLKKGIYPGSDIVVEETLTPGSNYHRYIASYFSEDLKIYALLTVPYGDTPQTGWPIIIFNHGYIPPSEYVTAEAYKTYTDALSKNGYIVFESDYRGHGKSEGHGSNYGSQGYTIDVLNAVASIKKYPQADPKRIGMWGHSMGGHIALRTMVSSKDIKAGVIWAGVVASYSDLLVKWKTGIPAALPSNSPRNKWRGRLIEEFGTPEENPELWASISANSYLEDISGPLQLHHGTDDTSVSHEISQILTKEMQNAGKKVELHLYPGDDHDLSENFHQAMQRSVEFFDEHVKKIPIL